VIHRCVKHVHKPSTIWDEPTKDVKPHYIYILNLHTYLSALCQHPIELKIVRCHQIIGLKNGQSLKSNSHFVGWFRYC
jgi:hypothetical protein